MPLRPRQGPPRRSKSAAARTNWVALELNEVLARNRALAVRDYLHQKQLPEHTLIRVSFKGACCYVAANDTEEGRAANRRVEIEFKQRVQLTLGSEPP